MENQTLVSSFLEIAPDCSYETAMKLLKESNWDLQIALDQLYFSGNLNNVEQEQTLRPPLPVIRDTLYDQPYTYDAEDMMIRSRFWDDSDSDLATLYRPPLELMFCGSFEEAKVAATAQDKWLLVNLQSSKEFNSHVMNRDLWSDETVAATIRSYFLFWQAQDDTKEGEKVCSYYKLDSFPVIVVIDPITGQKMGLSKGMIQPQYLLMDLLSSFMKTGPKNHPRVPFCRKHKHDQGPSEAMTEERKKKKKKMKVYTSLPEEPMGDRNMVCRVAVRLPDGRRIQRSFLREDPIELLWSFCYYEIEEAKKRPFGLTVAIPGASKCLDYDSEMTFEKSGISNSIISLTWE